MKLGGWGLGSLEEGVYNKYSFIQVSGAEGTRDGPEGSSREGKGGARSEGRHGDSGVRTE